MPPSLSAAPGEYPQHVQRYLSVAPRTVLFSCRVNGQASVPGNNPDDYGTWLDEQSGNIYMLHYDTETGDATACEEGFTIEVGSAAGKRDIGIFALRGPIDTVNKRIPVSETPYGQSPVLDNHYIAVIKEVRPQTRIVRLVATERSSSGALTNFIEYHDYDEAYVNQNHEIIPVANINQPSTTPSYRINARAAGFVDNTGFFRITLTSEFSYSINGNTVTPTWDIDDCTLIGMGATLNDEEITIDCPPGHRLIKLIVEDDVTGRVSKPRYHPVHAHHPTTYPPIEYGTRGFRVKSDERLNGRRMEFDIFGQFDDATETIFPRGAQCIYWEIPYFNGEDIPELYIREFVGWIVSKEFDPERYRGSLTLKVWGVEGWMAEVLGGFGTDLVDEGTLPGKWFQMEDITLAKSTHYILREYSTVLMCANLYLPTSLTRRDKREAVNKDKLFGQIKTIAEGFGYAVGVDSGNSIYVVPDPYYRQDGGAGVAVIFQINSDYIVKSNGLNIVESEAKSVGLVEGTGSVWDGVADEPDIHISRAPGLYPGEGDGTENRFWRVDNQAQVEYFTGQLYTRLNSRFKSFTLTLITNADIFETCWREFILVDYDEPTLTGYQITTSTRFMITKISVSHSNEIGSPRKRITLELEEVQYGNPGVTYIPPESESFTFPNPEPINIINQPALPPLQLELQSFPVAEFTPQVTPENPTPAAQQLGFAITHLNKKLIRSYHYLDEKVIWEDITPPSEKGDMIDYQAINDGAGGVVVYAFFKASATIIRMWKCLDAKAQNFTWTQEFSKTIVGTGFSGKGSVDFDESTDFAACCYLCEDGVYALVKDGTWSTVPVVVGSDTFTDNTVDSRDIQLIVDGDIVTVCGATGNQEYALFQADGNDTFVEMTDSPTFTTPVNSLVKNGTTAYAASWDGDGSGGGAGNTYEEKTTSASPNESVEECTEYNDAADFAAFTLLNFDGAQTIINANKIEGADNTLANAVFINFEKTLTDVLRSVEIEVEYETPSPVQEFRFYIDGVLESLITLDTPSPKTFIWEGISSGEHTYSFLGGVTGNTAGGKYIRVPYIKLCTQGAVSIDFDVQANVENGGNGNDSFIDVNEGDTVIFECDPLDVWNGGTVPNYNADGGGGTHPLAYLPSAQLYSMIYRIGTAGDWAFSGLSHEFVAPSSGRIYFLCNDVPGAYSDNSGFITVSVTIIPALSNSLIDPIPDTSNSAGFFSGMLDTATYPLVWDLTDDDPKQFDEDKGFLQIRWNFLESQSKSLKDLKWYLNIRYSSDLSTTPENTTRLRFKWKITVKEKDQPPDFATGELLFTKAASTLFGTTGNYYRLMTSPDMMVGLDLDNKELEYIEMRADLIPPGIDLVDLGSGETFAEWRIFTSPYGGSGSPAVTYKEVVSSGSRAYRITNYKTAPAWIDITPDPDNSDADTAGRCAKFKYGIAVDVITPATIYMCAYDEINSWLIKSEDSGDNWTKVAHLKTNWVFVADTTFLTGGNNVLLLALDGLANQIQRVGDMTRFEAFPNVRHTFVMTGF